MAFNFLKWLFGSRDSPTEVTGAEFFDIFTDAYVRELAFQSCVNLTANAVSKCEVKTFSAGAEVKGPEYYLWNFAPNQNQNSSAFWHKLIHTLYRDRTALVIENAGSVYVADSFNRKQYALYDDVFSNVAVGDFTFGRTFAASDVLFFELTDQDMKVLVNGLYQSYGQLIQYGMAGYQRSRGEKGTLEIDAVAAGDKKAMDGYNSIVNGGFKTFAQAENAIMPIYKGMKYTSLANKTYNSDTSRDIRAMIDDVTDFTARAFGIPACLLNGSVQDVSTATDQFLTFCIDPLVDNLAEEMNRKRYGKAVLKGDYLQIDTNSVKHIDLLDQATNIDKLVSSGVECVNDLRALLGQPLINEPWAWQHFMTKNYSTVEELLAAMGGESN